MSDKISPVQYSMKFSIHKPHDDLDNNKFFMIHLLNIFDIKLSVFIKGIIIRKIYNLQIQQLIGIYCMDSYIG
jgi:hypothetical protein